MALVDHVTVYSCVGVRLGCFIRRAHANSRSKALKEMVIEILHSVVFVYI